MTMDASDTHTMGDPNRERLQISMPGRYLLLETEAEYACRTYEISTAEVSLFAPVVGRPGAEVVVYLAELGRLAGVIARVTDKGFDMSLRLPARKREKLAAQLAWRAGRGETTQERRRHERIRPETDITILRLKNGREHVVRIRSLSASGVALESDHAVRMGDEVVVGSTPARVVRIRDDETACEFLTPFERIDPSTRL
jgi:hypothetical protein